MGKSTISTLYKDHCMLYGTIYDKIYMFADNNGTRFYHKMGVDGNIIFHRTDGPAVERVDGGKEWYENGHLHRLDGPAVEYANGHKEWYIEDVKYTEEEFNRKIRMMQINKSTWWNYALSFGELKHYKDEIYYNVDKYETKRYWNDGKFHRDDGPAVECSDGYKAWYKNGKLHREDGPAIIQYGPAIIQYGLKKWFLNGEEYTEEDYYKKINGPQTSETPESKIDSFIENNKALKLLNPKDYSISYNSDKKIIILNLQDREYHFSDGNIVFEKTRFKTKYLKNNLLHRDDGPAVEFRDGKKEWCKEGKLHRTDGPAIEWPDGSKEYFINGFLHREDGPAIEWKNGVKEWYKNGERHREDGPAVEKNSSKTWWKNGKLHRLDGPAIEYADGGKEWWVNGKLHREDGPAQIFKNRKSWYKNNVLHRDDGPAVESELEKSWWSNGIFLKSEKVSIENNIEVEENNIKTEENNNSLSFPLGIIASTMIASSFMSGTETLVDKIILKHNKNEA